MDTFLFLVSLLGGLYIVFLGIKGLQKESIVVAGNIIQGKKAKYICWFLIIFGTLIVGNQIRVLLI